MKRGTTVLYQDNEFIKSASEKKNDIVNSLLPWAKKHKRDFPWRATPTPYSILVAEILLRRTTAQAVSKIYPNFIYKFPTISTLSGASQQELVELIKPIGYYQRAKMLVEAAQLIRNEFNCLIPPSKEELMRIPNIGQYTAGAILSFGFAIKASMVDSNIERIIRRVNCKSIKGKGQGGAVSKIVECYVPDKEHQLFNYGLIDLGALVCRSQHPLHDECPIKLQCDTYHKLMQDKNK